MPLDNKRIDNKRKWKGNLNNIAVIYYQGRNSSQFQAIRYLGGEAMVASTGEVAKLNTHCINTILPQTLWTYPEIDELNKKPFFSFLSKIKFCWKGISLFAKKPELNPYNPLYPTDEKDSVFSYAIDNNKRSLGQSTDIIAHEKKYKSLTENHPERTNIICYGASRGSATTFAAIANNEYQNVKLCVLEAPPGSIRNLVKAKVPFGLGRWVHNSFLSKWFFGNQYQTNKEFQAQAYVDKFPLDIPLVIVSSILDSTVPHDNSLKLAQMVAHKRIESAQRGISIAPVYFIQLDTPDHNDYYRVDKSKDAARYQNILHAIYKNHNLPYMPELAVLGEEEIENTLLTKGVLAEQVEYQAQYKQNKKDRHNIKAKGLEHLEFADATQRQRSVCSQMRMYRNNTFSFFQRSSNEIDKKRAEPELIPFKQIADSVRDVNNNRALSF